MNLDETPAEIAARSQMASALQQLGHSLVGHRVDIELAEEVAAIARDLTANVAARPARDRTREMASNPRFAGILSGRSSEGIGLDGQIITRIARGFHARVVQHEFDHLDGALYTSLHRMEERGWVASSWGTSDKGKRAKFYELTAAGRKRLALEIEHWQRMTAAVQVVLSKA